MANFTPVFYRQTDGSQPVQDFLRDLPPKVRPKVRNQIGRLSLCSDEMPHLPFPHSSQVDGELRELRCHFGGQAYRVLYARSERLLVLLHAFAKNSKQIPRGDIELGRQRFEDFRRRMDESPRRRPRAAGGDAP
jgi:phage-related protein